MKFALGVPLMHRGEDNAFLTGEAMAALAQAAEKAGYDALYITEHPIPGDKWLRFGGHHAPDPFIGLAFAAAVTTKLKLLTNLTVVPYRNPFLLAKTVATLDRMSNGRVILGVGTGYLKPEYFAMGVDFEERNDLFDESIEVMRKTWTGEAVTYTGRHFDARDVRALPRPAQDTVPIWIGGNSKLTRRRVAEKAQGWMPMPNPADVARTTRSPVVETSTTCVRCSPTFATMPTRSAGANRSTSCSCAARAAIPRAPTSTRSNISKRCRHRASWVSTGAP